MRINLSNIIEMPDSSIEFSCEPDSERLLTPSVSGFIILPYAVGKISNTAGILSLNGTISCRIKCKCDRCGNEFPENVSLPVSVRLASEPTDVDDPDIFPLEGNWLDLSDLLETFFILNSKSKYLCSDDCAGICDRCGKNLNDGPCGCTKEIDPRMAVLQQLLDKKDE